MRVFVLLMSLLLTACGFHLRGHAGMPFSTLYLNAANPNTPFIADLRQNLTVNNIKLVNSAEKADVILSIESEVLDKQILSLSGGGRVSEFQLFYRVSVRAYDNQQRDWIPTEIMEIRRDYSYDDTKILAKEQEEAMLVQSMRTDMVQQIIRRLSRSKALPPQ
ncbi:LPS-assembly lipoprotein LptE [Ferrigenium kumadai]|uniref:LPS-assembly lipoprotein LptE n=1 Tax=Ferrigenium kumadai TaxID=1682490 RepID=A0AAN1T2E8_9PROT|nr:LPS assembly lipoprotein LptE [Ferrigenium kumadai]BBJ00585.1 LPS-assembly lipoprotein LptE [Ferrigenium kumadai]